MKNIVFVEKIGEIFNGDVVNANQHYEKYKELSMRGIGRFADRDVYLLNENRDIIKSHGNSVFAMGGQVLDSEKLFNDFIVGKKLNNDSIKHQGYMALQSDGDSVLMHITKNGQYPMIKVKNGSAIFFKSYFENLSNTEHLHTVFVNSCLKNAIKFSIQ